MGTPGNRDGQWASRSVLNDFTEDALSRQFVPKWDNPNCEGELVTARTTSLLTKFINAEASL